MLDNYVESKEEIISQRKKGEEGFLVYQKGGDVGNDDDNEGELVNGGESILRK